MGAAAGTRHSVVNAGATPLWLLTIYGPPDHRDGVVQGTRAEAHSDRFDGVTSA